MFSLPFLGIVIFLCILAGEEFSICKITETPSLRPPASTNIFIKKKKKRKNVRNVILKIPVAIGLKKYQEVKRLENIRPTVSGSSFTD